MPYNLFGNAQWKRYNHIFNDLVKALSNEQKGNWPLHLPPLVFAYHVIPHSTTHYQSYELMFGRKAPTHCDTWIMLVSYNDNHLQKGVQV